MIIIIKVIKNKEKKFIGYIGYRVIYLKLYEVLKCINNDISLLKLCRFYFSGCN